MWPDYDGINAVPTGDMRPPHKPHPSHREPLPGLDGRTPENNIPIGLLPEAIRQVKHIFNTCLTLPVHFAEGVEDGDLVVPLIGHEWHPQDLPPQDVCYGTILETIWVPAFRNCRYPIDWPEHKPVQPREGEEAASGALGVGLVSDSVAPARIGHLPYYGVAYKKEGKVMLGPVVAHPRFAYPVGSRLYASQLGDVTIHKTDIMVGVCVAPGFLYLMPYAAEIDRLVKHINALAGAVDEKLQSIVDKIINEGIDLSNCTVLVPGTDVERPLYDRFGDWVNIKDFGAVGDGDTNNATYIDNAIAYAQKLGDNACLFIPVGRYATSKLPTVPCYGPGTIVWRQRDYKPFELLFTLRGGISADRDGRYFVDCPDIIADDSGLSVDKNGDIKVDFTDISDEKRKEIVESLLPGHSGGSGSGEGQPGSGGGLVPGPDGSIIIDISNMNVDELKKLIQDLIGEMDTPLFPNPDTGNLDFDFDNMTEEQLQKLIYRLIQQGGGLDVDEKGQIFVDFSLMPDDKFEKVAFDLGIPITLKANRNFYVNGASGKDSETIGWGTTPETAFKTIGFACEYVCRHFNMASFTATILVYPGTYNEKVVCGSFTATTGSIIVRPVDLRASDSSGYSVVITRSATRNQDATVVVTGRGWSFIDLAINMNGTFDCSGLNVSGILNLYGCKISLSGKSGQVVVSSYGGNVWFRTHYGRYNDIVANIEGGRALRVDNGSAIISTESDSIRGGLYISGRAGYAIWAAGLAFVSVQHDCPRSITSFIGTRTGFSGKSCTITGNSSVAYSSAVALPGSGVNKDATSSLYTVSQC